MYTPQEKPDEALLDSLKTNSRWTPKEQDTRGGFNVSVKRYEKKYRRVWFYAGGQLLAIEVTKFLEQYERIAK